MFSVTLSVTGRLRFQPPPFQAARCLVVSGLSSPKRLAANESDSPRPTRGRIQAKGKRQKAKGKRQKAKGHQQASKTRQAPVSQPVRAPEATRHRLHHRPQTSDLRPQTSDLRPQTSDLGPQTSDLGPQTSDLRPRTSDLRPRPISPDSALTRAPPFPTITLRIPLPSVTPS